LWLPAFSPDAVSDGIQIRGEGCRNLAPEIEQFHQLGVQTQLSFCNNIDHHDTDLLVEVGRDLRGEDAPSLGPILVPWADQLNRTDQSVRVAVGEHLHLLRVRPPRRPFARARERSAGTIVFGSTHSAAHDRGGQVQAWALRECDAVRPSK
jgi:hypothetical protein